jgi:hypothetical protein
MLWPPDEQEWCDLRRSLPSDADHAMVRQQVEAAVQEYVGDAGRDRELSDIYEAIGRLAGLQKVQELRQWILKLRNVQNFPIDPVAETLLRMVDGLIDLPSLADIQAAIYLPSVRRQRFLSRLSLTWTGPGKGTMPISETGPFADFIYAIGVHVLDSPPPQGSGHKAFVKRELERRAALENILWQATVQTTLMVDAVVPKSP